MSPAGEARSGEQCSLCPTRGRRIDVVSVLECPHGDAHDRGCHYNEGDSNKEGHAVGLPWQRGGKRRARSSLAERSSAGPARGPYPCSVTLSQPWAPSGVEASFHLSSVRSHCQSDPQTGQCHRSLSRVARSGTVHRGAGLGTGTGPSSRRSGPKLAKIKAAKRSSLPITGMPLQLSPGHQNRASWSGSVPGDLPRMSSPD